jgi:hypothetical protein
MDALDEPGGVAAVEDCARLGVPIPFLSARPQPSEDRDGLFFVFCMRLRSSRTSLSVGAPGPTLASSGLAASTSGVPSACAGDFGDGACSAVGSCSPGRTQLPRRTCSVRCPLVSGSLRDAVTRP